MKKITTTVFLILSILFTIPLVNAGILPTSKILTMEEGPIYEVYNATTKKWSEAKLDRNPEANGGDENFWNCLLYTSPSPRD